MNRYLFPLLLALLTLPARAQDTWSLERCIDYALEHNVDIRKQEIGIAAKQIELTRRRLDHLPALNAQIAQEYNWGRSVDMQELVIVKNKLTRATGASLSASLSLFEGLARHAQRMAARKALQAAAFDADGGQNEREGGSEED